MSGMPGRFRSRRCPYLLAEQGRFRPVVMEKCQRLWRCGDKTGLAPTRLGLAPVQSVIRLCKKLGICISGTSKPPAALHDFPQDQMTEKMPDSQSPRCGFQAPNVGQ